MAASEGQEPLLQVNQVVGDNFRVVGPLGEVSAELDPPRTTFTTTLLQQGTFSEIFTGINTNTNELVALKLERPCELHQASAGQTWCTSLALVQAQTRHWTWKGGCCSRCRSTHSFHVCSLLYQALAAAGNTRRLQCW